MGLLALFPFGGLRLLASWSWLQQPLSALLGIAGAVLLLAGAASAGEPIRILALGDSLTAGYGLNDLGDAFPSQLEKALRAKGHDVAIVQGGISGDTSIDGRSRLEWSLAAKPDAVIVELGANDALRAVDPKVTEDNMRAILQRLRKDGLPVLLAGMLAPPNLGRDYAERFNPIYPKLAKEFGVLLHPFFLDGVAAIPELNQGDHIHPNPQGVKIIIQRIVPLAEKLVGQAEARRKGTPPPAAKLTQ